MSWGTRFKGIFRKRKSVPDTPNGVGRTQWTPDDVPEMKRIAALPREDLKDMAESALQNLDPAHLFGYAPVAAADAVAELAFPTMSVELDFIHETLIDCLQHGYLRAVRDNKGVLRFGITEAGREHVSKFLGLE